MLYIQKIFFTQEYVSGYINIVKNAQDFVKVLFAETITPEVMQY